VTPSEGADHFPSFSAPRNGFLSGLVSATATRFVLGMPQEDERTKHARLAGMLLLLGATSGLSLLALLPARIERPQAAVWASICLLLGLGITYLPWHRWPAQALVAPLVLAFPCIFLGGILAGDLDFYALELPLLYLYCGCIYPPRYSGWLFLASLAALCGTALVPQPPGAVAFVLLGSLLGAVCGVVVALQRQDGQRGQESMRQLAEAASILGAAKHPEQVARLMTSTATSLLDAAGVVVLLPCAAGQAPSVSATAGCLRGLLAEGEPAGQGLLVLLRHGATSEPGFRTAAVGGPAAGERAYVQVAIPDPQGGDAAIVCELRSPIRRRDHYAVRALEKLAVEGGRVLDRLAHAETLRGVARTDALTGLGNRLVLDEALAAMQPGDTVMLLDLDHFKLINDRYGHSVGDEVLRQFAEVLRRTMRTGQVLTRYGGEEFALIARGLPDERLAQYLSSLRSVWVGTYPLTTYSCGVAVKLAGESGHQALVRADGALFRAKRQGRHCDVLDEPEPALS
jgi:diguanylate cyclase (GGDEF)-like protein